MALRSSKRSSSLGVVRPASDHLGFPARLAGLKKRVPKLPDGAAVTDVLVTNPKDVAYLTGFHGGDSYLIVPIASRKGRPRIISDFRYAEELEPLKAFADVILRPRSMHEAVVAAFAPQNGTVLGIQADAMTVGEHQRLGSALGAGRIRSLVGLVADARTRKDSGEIAALRAALKVQQAALLATLPHIEPGQTEAQVAARLESEMKARGSTQPAFTTIVAAGANGSLPHYRAAKVKIRDGSPLLIDWGAVVGGYHGDMTRTFAVGGWNKGVNRRIADIYRIVLDAHEAGAAALRPGVRSSDVDAAARQVITKAGYGDQFGHGLGHGIGLDIHEGPRLTNMAAGTTLEPGMVVTIEPGIYLPGVGGVRIEDDYLITARGAENLCTLPKSLSWASL